MSRMAKSGLEKDILRYMSDSMRPVSTRDIAIKVGIAWHTADRYCLKLQISGKVSSFTIGKSTAWFIKNEKRN